MFQVMEGQVFSASVELDKVIFGIAVYFNGDDGEWVYGSHRKPAANEGVLSFMAPGNSIAQVFVRSPYHTTTGKIMVFEM